MNSLKMKMAVIFGVAQMSLGIVLKGTNAIHNKNMIDFLFEFCPQIIILVALFGYMDFMIIMDSKTKIMFSNLSTIQRSSYWRVGEIIWCFVKILTLWSVTTTTVLTTTTFARGRCFLTPNQDCFMPGG